MLDKKTLVNIRRQLHVRAELALEEYQTANYLEQFIAKLPQKHLTIRKIAQLPTALLVKIQGSQARRNLGYRADMDALPLTEESSDSYVSKQKGVMHACGHDFHMTIALSVLAYFAHEQPQDNLVFFFQPAEESYSGAKTAFDAHVFTDDWQIDEIYALHVQPDLAVGEIGCRLGTLFAGTAEVNIDFVGLGGHAAAPQKAHDAVVAAAYFITLAQTIVARDIAPAENAVVTFGQLEAGTIRNIIAQTAHLKGTIRGLDQTMLVHIKQRLEQIARGIAQSFQMQVQVDINQGSYLPVVNDAELTLSFINRVRQNPNVHFVETAPAMTGEDFGYLLHEIPGFMFWLGVNSSGSLHSSAFQPQEDALVVGVQTVIDWLQFRMTR